MLICDVILDSDAAISALVFHPQKNMAVSCSYGGNFKVTFSPFLVTGRNIFLLLHLKCS